VIAELPVKLGIVVLEELAIVEGESGIALPLALPLWHESEVTGPPIVYAEVDRIDRWHIDLRVRLVRIACVADHPAEHDPDPRKILLCLPVTMKKGDEFCWMTRVLRVTRPLCTRTTCAAVNGHSLSGAVDSA
jgi:hypothetical protein